MTLLLVLGSLLQGSAPAPDPAATVLAAPGLHAVSIQLLGGRWRSEVGDLSPRWEYSFGAAYSRLWRLGSSSAHALGVRIAVSVPGFEGVEVAPQLEYRWGDVSTVNLSWGPLWTIDEARKGAGGHRLELAVNPGAYPWALYVGMAHSVFGRPALAVVFGIRFELRLPIARPR